MSENNVNFGICLPKIILQQLDDMRGDVNRSLFIRRLIEKRLGEKKNE